MDGIQILFGKHVTTTENTDGSSQIVEEHINQGARSYCVRRTTETVIISNNTQVLSEFLKLMDLIKADSKLFDPEFKACMDKKSGNYYKVYRSWSEKVVD